MRARHLALWCACMLAALTIVSPARAYTVSHCQPVGALRPAAELPMQWYINEDGYSGLPFAEVRQTMQTAFDAWASPQCTAFEHVYSGTTSAREYGDARNVMVFEESNWTIAGPSTIARTLEFITPDCVVLGADIVFNALNWTFIDGTPGAANEVDLQSLATHEVGHILGLDHSETPGSALQFTYSGGLSERTLNQDNVNGACALYPSPTSCTDSGDCADSQVCNGGVCDRQCFGDDFCASPRTCEVATTRCLAKICTVNSQCDKGESCDGSECILDRTCGVCAPCSIDDDCGGGQICSDALDPRICTQVCGPTTPCPGDSGCFDVVGAATSICLNDDAMDRAVGPCPTNYVCDSSLGVTCSGNSLPDPSDGLCKSPCEMADCTANESCDPVSGSCSPIIDPNGGDGDPGSEPTGDDPSNSNPDASDDAGGCAAVPSAGYLWVMFVGFGWRRLSA